MIETADMNTPLHQIHNELYQQFLEAEEKFDHAKVDAKQRRIEIAGDEEDPEKLTRDIEMEHMEYALDLAQEYEDLTQYHLQLLLNFKSERSLPESDEKVCKRIEVMLKEERNTWRLARALYKDQMASNQISTLKADLSCSQSPSSDQMDTSGRSQSFQTQPLVGYSEDQIIGDFYVKNDEIRRMQVVCDWLEANEASESDSNDMDDKAEFYSEGPVAWENTFHAMRAKYNIHIPDLDMTINQNAGLELCSAMDPDAPIRTKTSLVHTDKEQEIRLFKHLFKSIRAGKLSDGQELAQRVGYHWLAAMLDGWLPYSDPNLDEEHLGQACIHQPSEIKPVTGNKKRDIWKQTCFSSAKIQGLSSAERAILGVLGGNLKSVLPICHSWSDQLWARLKCSIDVKIEKALKESNLLPQENRSQTDFPKEFYDNFQTLNDIFNSIKDLKIVSPFKEATIHQTVQKYLILNDVDGLLNQLSEWCKILDYDNNLDQNGQSISPHFLRFFAHVILFLREFELVEIDDHRGSSILESYIALLTRQRSLDKVAHYTIFLPKDNQVISYAKLLATIEDRDERRHYLEVARESKMEIDEITQTVVDLILNELPPGGPAHLNTTERLGSTTEAETTTHDKRKINSLDYLLYLEQKNYMAILHHSNKLLRHFALQRKMDALQETYSKLPKDLIANVEDQWRLYANQDEVTLGLRNNIRELESFRLLLEVQTKLSEWSQCHRNKPEEPKKPATFTKFCDNVNFEKSIKQFQAEKIHWKQKRDKLTDLFVEAILQMVHYPGGWMSDLQADDATSEATSRPSSRPNTTDIFDGTQQQHQFLSTSLSHDRLDVMDKLRKIFIPHMISVYFNILHLTQRYEECLKISHLLVAEELNLHEQFSKAQLRDFLDKISEVTKTIVKKSLANEC